MDAQDRRDRIVELLGQGDAPVSASRLARDLGVSRQIIVGDIALLRAGGHDVLATARGYILPERSKQGRLFSKLACQHDGRGAKEELYTIVELGGHVLDVIVEHDLYGEITGQLNLSTRQDVDAFIALAAEKNARLLSELTGGVHLHTIACRDAAHLEEIRRALAEKGVLYQGYGG